MLDKKDLYNGGGFVELHETMGNDKVFCDCARVSFANDGKETTDMEDFQLLDYLIRNHHTSPLEMGQFRFKIKCPIFIKNQIFRHRTAKMNEWSGRYTELPAEFFEPDDFYEQSKSNKQGRSESIAEDSGYFKEAYHRNMTDTFGLYQRAIQSNLSKEMARINLPLSTYTVFYWSMDVSNLLHFLSLRLHYHSQAEIRDVSKAILDLIKPYIPMTIRAFENQVLNSQTFSKRETLAILDFLRASGGEAVEMILARMPDKREQRILKDKLENYTKHLIDIGD